MTTTFIVARHGTVFEPDEMPTRIGVRTDLSLSEPGREQARQLGQYLKTNGYLPATVYSAFLARARETADIVLDTMRLQRQVQNLHILNEIDYGPDENQPEADVIARIGRRAIDDWGRMGVVPEGWEANPDAIKQSWLDLANQVQAQDKGKTVLAVTNVGVGVFSLAITGDFNKAARNYGLKLSTGGLSIFTKEPEDHYWKVKEWNVRPKGNISGVPMSRRF